MVAFSVLYTLRRDRGLPKSERSDERCVVFSSTLIVPFSSSLLQLFFAKLDSHSSQFVHVHNNHPTQPTQSLFRCFFSPSFLPLSFLFLFLFLPSVSVSIYHALSPIYLPSFTVEEGRKREVACAVFIFASAYFQCSHGTVSNSIFQYSMCLIQIFMDYLTISSRRRCMCRFRLKFLSMSVFVCG